MDALVELDGVLTHYNILQCAPLTSHTSCEEKCTEDDQQWECDFVDAECMFCEQECDQQWEWDYFDGNTHSL